MYIIDEQKTALAIAILGVVLLTIIIVWVIKSYMWRRAIHRIYLCIDYFVRNLHEQTFYHPINHNAFVEYADLYTELKGKRHKWYFSEERRNRITEFINTFDQINEYIGKMSKYMGEDHYFAHSEFLKCKEYAKFEGIKVFIDNKFLKYVNKKEPASLSTIGKYYEELDCDISNIAQKHNSIFVENELKQNKEFFDTVLEYPLDQQQRESIVKLEDNALVISSAGSGKTSTTVGKIKYLVEKRGILPKNILPLTYTTKAAEGLEERLSYQDKGMECHTFHSLAYDIVRKVTHNKPDVCEENLILTSFYHQAKVNPDFKATVNVFLTKRASLTKNQHDYQSAEEYLRDRALYGIMAPYLDMKNRIIFTKSEEEKKICTFLSMNNIEYEYEAPYPYNTATETRKQYKPDFTIYFNRGNIRYRLFLEHFGIDADGNVPFWFGDGKPGGWRKANLEYNEGIRWKRELHATYGTQLIETTSAMFADETIYDRLTEMLNTYGVPMRLLTEEEQFEKMVVRNERMEESLLQLISTFINLVKANRKTPEDIYKVIRKEKSNDTAFLARSRFMINYLFKPVYEDYQTQLEERHQVDYTDLIIKATDLCNEGKYDDEYDYILVDEFQDISVDRFNLLQAIRRKDPLTKLYCVGDDWQSIFRFSGSDLTLFSDFEEYFGFTEKSKIETTYRFGNPLLKHSSAFILKNPKQVTKEVKPFNKSAKTELSSHKYNEELEISQLSVVLDLVNNMPQDESVMFIARYRADADFLKDYINSRDVRKRCAKDIKIGTRIIPFYTVHSAKGLEADHVILLNCSQSGSGFPSRISDDPILGFLLSKPDTYPFAEERRLFYVAITRAKKHTYIVYDENCPSSFLSDIPQSEENKNVMLCPMCKTGTLKYRRGDDSQPPKWALYGCTNRTAACPFTWFVKYSDESEIERKYNQIWGIRGIHGVPNRAAEAPMYIEDIKTNNNMHLKSDQILTLQQLSGIGPAAIKALDSYVYDNKLSIEKGHELWDVMQQAIPAKVKGLNYWDFVTTSSAAKKIIDASRQKGIYMLGCWDTDFPEMLKNVTDEEGKSKPCVLLFYKGNLGALKKPGFAIIGTREPDEDGQKAGPYFAHAFAQQGLNIVSGLALGCDTMAHRGALAVGGTTTAFLAHGLDTVYPPENEALANEIVANGGLLLSEDPIGTSVSKYSLVARDRLQSALSKACLVIETGVNGGTMHAARATLAANKPLYVVDYNDKSGDAKQGNELLVTKGAKRLTSKDDIAKIANEIKAMGEQNTNPQMDLFV